MAQIRMKVLVISAIIAIFAFATLSSSLTIRATIAEIREQNADDAEALQEKFSKFTVDQECTPDEICCIGKDFAKCATVLEGEEFVNRFQIQPCNGDLKCAVLPLVLVRGTSITCTTEEDHSARLEQARKNL